MGKSEGNNSTKGGRRAGGPIQSVQWIRALAALMVVFGHSAGAIATLRPDSGGDRHGLLPWGVGVDLFFAVSGFIMVHASLRLFGQPGAGRIFLWRRLTRIVPLYWAATTLYLSVLALARWKGGAALPSAIEIFSSYLFVPYAVDGGMPFPVLSLGWTLNYEIFFYVVFAGCVGLPRRAALMTIGSVLPALVVAGWLIPETAGAAHFWTRPILLDFLAGLMIGIVAYKHVQLSPAWRWALVLTGLTLLAADPCHVFSVPLGTTVANGMPRVLAAGLPAAAVLAGAVLGPAPARQALLRPLARIGDASYSLYLLHPFAIIAMEKAAQKLAFVRALPTDVLLLGTVGLAIVAALAGFHVFERPVTAALNRLLTGSSKPALSPATPSGAPS